MRKPRTPEQKRLENEKRRQRRLTDPEYRLKMRAYGRKKSVERRLLLPEEHAAHTRKRRERWREGVGKIYFLIAGSAVKIGFTSQKVEGRLKQLQPGNPEELRILGWMLGNRVQETLLHDRFLHLKLRHEWFKATPELLEFVKSSITTALSVETSP